MRAFALEYQKQMQKAFDRVRGFALDEIRFDGGIPIIKVSSPGGKSAEVSIWNPEGNGPGWFEVFTRQAKGD